MADDIVGVKRFRNDMTCMNKYKYTMGETHHHRGEVKVGESGLHLSLSLVDIIELCRDDIYCRVVGSGKTHRSGPFIAAEYLHVVEPLNGWFDCTTALMHFKDGKLHDADGQCAFQYDNGDVLSFKNGNFIKTYLGSWKRRQ